MSVQLAHKGAHSKTGVGHGKSVPLDDGRLDVEDVAVTFNTAGREYCAVGGINISVERGRFVAIIGPTGSGKSTILNSIAGLIRPSEGRVLIGQKPLEGVNKRAGYLFQQDALLPWKTLLDNVALGLEYARVPRAERAQRARDWISRVGLSGFEDSYPHQLSGGMRKRAALAQTWIVQPEFLLLDEPFAALDVQTRQLMHLELLSLWSESNKTVILVTHDLDEAVSLADEVLLLSSGPRSTIVGRYQIDIERPRDLLEIRSSPEFNEHYKQIWSDLKVEVMKGYERNFSVKS